MIPQRNQQAILVDSSEILAGVVLNLTGAGIGVIPSGPEQGLALLAPMGINNVSGTQYNALETFITNSFDGIDLETTGAHLVFLFFDRQMQLDPSMSSRIGVGDANTLGQITQQSMRMPDDGFFYVYTTTLSARSYYFDKLKIKRWKFDSSYVLQSETLEMSIPRASDSGPEVRVKYDYYPYGMLWNNPDLQDEESRLHDHAYQDKEFLFGEYDGTVGLALYDFHARMYDPATGRWLVPDPAAQFANPYLAMGNNPVIGVDPDGQFIVLALGLAVVGGYIGGAVQNDDMNPGDWNWERGSGTYSAIGIGAMIGFSVGVGVGGAANMGSGFWAGSFTQSAAGTGFNMATQASMTSLINMGSSYIQGRSLEEIAVSGSVGFGAGLIGGAIGSYKNTSAFNWKGGGNHINNWHFGSTRTMNVWTSTINGGADRYALGRFRNKNGGELWLNVGFGMAEGFYSGYFFGGEYGFAGKGEFGLAGRYASTLISNSITSVPGLGMAMAQTHFIVQSSIDVYGGMVSGTGVPSNFGGTGSIINNQWLSRIIGSKAIADGLSIGSSLPPMNIGHYFLFREIHGSGPNKNGLYSLSVFN